MNNNLFRFIVYCISFYLLLIKNSKLINLVGLIILISHIIKDIIKFERWYYWCDYCGLILCLVLIIEGYNINNNFIILLGIIKCIAHLRQIIYKDNQYYSFN